MNENKCYHCGEPSEPNPVPFDGRIFCCHGCRMVYEILSNNNACDYYKLEEGPGKRADHYGWGQKYAFLDHPEIRDALLEFSEGDTARITLFVPAIHCSACIWLLENLQRFSPGILNSQVNFVKRKVTLVFRQDLISLRQLVELLVSLNYIPEISQDTLNREVSRTMNRSLYYRIGVAGFCFMNIMMFSFPAYLSADEVLEAFMQQNFGLFNILLGIPVAFYSGWPYLISAWKGISKRIISIDLPIAVGILVLFFRSLFEIVSGSGHGFMDSLAGLVFFLLVGRWYQGKTYEALSFERDYRSYFPVAVTLLLEDMTEKIIPLAQLKVGMRILVRNQELVPADALLVSGQAYIDYSFVTGEATPHGKRPGDRIFAGGRQVGSSIELIVEREVAQSRLTELWNSDAAGQTKPTRWDPMIDALGRRFTWAILIIAALAMGVWWVVNPGIVFNVVTSVLIIACPCALALTLPFSFGGTMRLFGRNGLYLKKTQVVEALSHIDTVVFDKTGTITQNDLFDVDFTHLALDGLQKGWLRSLARHSTHPLSVALYRALDAAETMAVEDFEERPSEGLEGRVEGHVVRAGSATFTGSMGKDASDGSVVYVSVDGQPAGYVLVKNRYRPGMKEVMIRLGKRYELHLLSGDNDAELEALLPLFPSRDHLHFGLAPVDKLNYILELKARGRQVLMIGDGLNDAGALRESDCGISIADDVYHFSPACDAILESGRFSYLPQFLGCAKSAVTIVRLSLIFSLLYNAVGLGVALSANLTPVFAAILMPVSSVTVVLFITISLNIAGKRAGLKI